MFAPEPIDVDDTEPDAARARPACLDRALELLGARPHFRAELERKLAARGYASEEIDAALARLAELGHLEDTRLAVEEAGRRRERRALGRRALAAELRRKGAPEAAIRAALGERDAGAESERALVAARRWLRTHRPEAAALARHLDRKGYAAGEIARTLRTLELEAEAAEDAGD